VITLRQLAAGDDIRFRQLGLEQGMIDPPGKLGVGDVLTVHMGRSFE
jgi:hypothetical protein